MPVAMQSFWAVQPQHNPRVFMSGPFAPSMWTTNEEDAARFTTEDAAVNAIISQLAGKGRAVLVSMPALEEAAL